jgi:ergothioneine biosynthesis protein EgtB
MSSRVTQVPSSVSQTSVAKNGSVQHVLAAFQAVRHQTESLAAGLSAEDQMVQSCPEASPTKWHQAHTTWFFETFVLQKFCPGYRPFNTDFPWLFNSYYVGLGHKIPEKQLRSSFSRPSLDEILAYRAHVDSAMDRCLGGTVPEEAIRAIVLGLNHEQQHQELAYTDIKHAFFSNPLNPSYQQTAFEANRADGSLTFTSFVGGLVEIGYALDGSNPFDFCFDNETPRHKVYLEPFALGNRLSTCGEFLDFINDNGYTRPELWLSEGWDTIRREGWQMPLYWETDASDPTGYRVFTLGGWVGLSQLLDTPVCHISFFEADAFARWRGCRLPKEEEWELVSSSTPLAGNLLESGRLHPTAASSRDELRQLIGDCWEWTASAYTGYPGYEPLPGVLGEYNGKFMSSQMVLRGGSCVTPRSHMRVTYRNFFQPLIRWQFSGVRLAK